MQSVFADQGFETATRTERDCMPCSFQPFAQGNIGLDITPRAEGGNKNAH